MVVAKFSTKREHEPSVSGMFVKLIAIKGQDKADDSYYEFNQRCVKLCENKKMRFIYRRIVKI